MKVIFLDFDGVINNCGDIDDYIFYPVNDKSNRIHSLPFSASNIVPLKMLFDFLFKENIKIVLSTSWRQIISYKDLDIAFKNFLGFSHMNEKIIINEIPVIYESLEAIRGNEIKVFLENNPNISDYLIIDDNFDFLKTQKNHLILTNASIGFSEKDFQKVKTYFSKNKSNIFSQIFK